MKKSLYLLLLLSFTSKAQTKDSPYPFTVSQDSAYLRENYTKTEVMVTMRNGVKLFTQIYAPQDLTKKFPIIIQRTPYSCSPYGTNKFKRRISPNPFMIRENYIVVYQDVRGRWASEGKFVEMTPHLDVKKSKMDIDEASDTYDTIDWLTKNIPNNNGKVGQWGISYPGFFTSSGAISEHPALKASSPQAPMADLWRDDAFHNGAFMIAANFGFYNYFQNQEKPTTTRPPVYFENNNPDGYDYYLNEVKTTKNSEEGFYKGKNSYYHENFEHPNYDEHWKKRNILPHLKGIKHAVMVVGGWYDEQDLYGTFNTYKAIEKQNGFSADYMVEDQRFAYARPDVISFSSDILEKALTFSGPIKAMLKVATTGTDADWVVKVIDVYPQDAPPNPKKPEVVFGNYQQLVRSEIIRGKFRNSVEKPEPFVPNQITNVNVELQDVLHTFQKGHKIMVQIQSSCFPWADRNPQKFMDIFKAETTDYQKAMQKVYHQKGAMSFLKVGILE